MANNLNSNPYFVDTAAALWTKTDRPKSVRLVQWVDDAGDIADDSTITLIINGISLVVKYQMEATINPNIVVWQLGPFNPGIVVTDFNVSVMATGNLHVWIN